MKDPFGSPCDGGGNRIHPTAVIAGEVEFGRRNRILPYTVLIGPLRIGDDNVIGPHVTIGGPGQDTHDRYHDDSHARIEIGSRNIVLSHSSISKPVRRALTRMGDDCFLMENVHVAHDVDLQSQVTIAGMAGLAGLVHVLRGANLGIGSVVHQYSVLGHYSMVSMHAAVQKNVPPFSRYIPRVPLSVNHYAIEKYGFQEYTDEIAEYVLRRVQPTAPVLRQIVDEYQALHQESGRGQY